MFISEIFSKDLDEAYSSPPPMKDMIAVSGGDIQVGDKIRTKKMQMVGKVEKIEPEKTWNSMAVFFRVDDGRLMKTPQSNCVKINPEIEGDRIEEVNTATANRLARKNEPEYTHSDNCPYPMGHDCTCGKKTKTHSSNCSWHYGHECDCGFADKNLKEVKSGPIKNHPWIGRQVKTPTGIGVVRGVEREPTFSQMVPWKTVVWVKFADGSVEDFRKELVRPIKAKVDEGDVIHLNPKGEDKTEKMWKIMTPEEYKEIKHKLPKHETYHNVDGFGAVGVKLIFDELEQGYPN